jgi:release factor glutamine methyltransferase
MTKRPDRGPYTSRTPGFSERVVEGWVSMRDVLADAERRLASAGVPSPRTDAAILISHVTGIPRTRMLLQDAIAPEQRTQFERLLSRRMARVPLQHLVGTATFRHLDLAVGPGVFVPRPETELVAEAAIAALGEVPEGQRRAVDLCSGSGALALSLATEVQGAEVVAVEVDAAALEWTNRNVEIHTPAIADRNSTLTVTAWDARVVADSDGPLHSWQGTVDVVVSNPPYIPEAAAPREPEVRDHEPRIALFGGEDGLDVIREIVHTAAVLTKPGGLVVIEHADMQGEAADDSGVPGLLRSTENAAYWTQVHDHLDLTRRPRFTTARRTDAPAPVR